MSKKDRDTAKILGVELNSRALDQVTKTIEDAVSSRQKLVVVTPNPEFLVFSHQNPWFKALLNQADIAIPDGIGLILASKLLKTSPKITHRVTGADLTKSLLNLANQKSWKVGVVGSRKGDEVQRKKLISLLQKKYKNAKIFSLEDTKDWQKKNYQIIFACQGMGDQEKWIFKNKQKTNANIFLGAGGSLDFLTGFAKRAPESIRVLGFEWVYRLLKQPSRLPRQLKLIKFIFLVLKESRKASRGGRDLLGRRNRV